MKNIFKPNKLRVELPRSSEDYIISPIETAQDLTLNSPTPELFSLKQYEDQNREFVKEGVSYKRQSLIKGMSFEWQVSMKWSFLESYSLLLSVSTALLLNELEIAFWSIVLKSKNDPMIEPKYLAHFTAFLAKWNLNGDISHFEVYLNSILPNFRLCFYNWQLVSDFSCEISLRDINSRYNHLLILAAKNHKNYDLMVGELMQIPRRKISTISESYASEVSFEDIDIEKTLEEFELDLVEEAKLSPIDKFEN